MIILGIDPGLATTGWGIVQKEKDKINCLGVGVIKTSPKILLEKRLAEIYTDLFLLIKKFEPNTVVIENIFFNTNAKTALLVGQARGVTLICATLNKIPVVSFTPLQVKMALTGYGRADKSQIGKMVKEILKLDKIPRPDDAADALAIALTFCFTRKA